MPGGGDRAMCIPYLEHGLGRIVRAHRLGRVACACIERPVGERREEDERLRHVDAAAIRVRGRRKSVL